MDRLTFYTGDIPDLVEKLEQEAEKLDRSVSWVVKQALKKYFEESDNNE